MTGHKEVLKRKARTLVNKQHVDVFTVHFTSLWCMFQCRGTLYYLILWDTSMFISDMLLISYYVNIVQDRSALTSQHRVVKKSSPHVTQWSINEAKIEAGWLCKGLYNLSYLILSNLKAILVLNYVLTFWYQTWKYIDISCLIESFFDFFSL